MITHRYICFFLVVLMTASACRTYEHEATYEEMAARYEVLEENKKDSCLTPFIDQQNVEIPEGKELKQIMIVRHGKPLLDIHELYSWKEARNYIHAYDTVGVEEFVFNPVCMTKDLQNVYCSVLTRSERTAEYICGDEYVIVEDLMFREFERTILPIPFLRAPLKFWLITGRIPWIFGFGGIESYQAANQRAWQVANFLDQEAMTQNKALLVAHGFLNRYVFSDLKRMGWYQAKDGGNGYLSVSVFVKLVDKQMEEISASP